MEKQNKIAVTVNNSDKKWLKGKSIYPEGNVNIKPGGYQTFTIEYPYLELEIDIPEYESKPSFNCWSANDFIILKNKKNWRITFFFKQAVNVQTPTNVDIGIREVG